MKPHKWAKEIHAWADGAEIESYAGLGDEIWDDEPYPDWNHTVLKFRIKPKPKEPQYLYVYRTNEGDVTFEFSEGVKVIGYQYIGKIKLEEIE